jgi:hypothetical protein
MLANIPTDTKCLVLRLTYYMFQMLQLPWVIYETYETLSDQQGTRCGRGSGKPATDPNAKVAREPCRSGATYFDFALPRHADYLYSIKFHCHPLLTDRNIMYGDVVDRYRLAAADVDYVQLRLNDLPIITRTNNSRNEPVCYPHQMEAIWSAPIDFFRESPLITCALRDEVKLRIGFWREPATPFWITYTLGYVANKYEIPNHIVVDTYDGHQMNYSWGCLLNCD